MGLVLIVEDNSFFRQSLREMLELHFPELTIEEASNGDEALMVLQENHPDLIFMDIKLPGRNGLELTRTIKRNDSETNVIILTSYDIPEYREAASQSGASHFFTKGSTGSAEIAAAVQATFALKGKSLDSSSQRNAVV
jgi:DNA-binding NarL/FixJ family response regulator